MKARDALRLTAGAVVLLLQPLPAPAEGTQAMLDDVLALLAQRQHAEASFTEEQQLAVLTQPLRSSGRLIYDAPDHLEERTLTPRPQSLIVDHGQLSMKIGARSRTVRLADYPQLAPLIDSIRATLAGDKAGLERIFTLTFAGSLEHWQLQLTPRDAHSLLTQIDLSGARDAISEVRMRQRDGDQSIMHIVAAE
jgi:hypothetical protein